MIGSAATSYEELRNVLPLWPKMLYYSLRINLLFVQMMPRER